MPRLLPRLAMLTLAGLLLVCSLPTPADAVPLRNLGAKLGTNLEKVGPISRSWAFVDVFKASTGWSAQNSNGTPWVGPPLTLDSLGWVASLQPGQIAVARVLQQAGGHAPSGQYIVLYDGTGTIDFGFDASLVSSTPGRAVVQITPSPSGYSRIRITATDPADPIRNVRAIMPGFESTYATQVFHPEFLARLGRFRVLRFLNWTSSNNSPLVSWSQRTRLGAATQGNAYGVAPEYLPQLANRQHADLWINIPHLADDDYVTQLATLLRDSLDADLRVFVKHSNELWGDFTQSAYASQQGLAQGLSTNSRVAAMRWHSARSVHLFSLFDAVFGSGSDRLVRVLVAMHSDTNTGVEVMDWQGASLVSDVLTTAPYYGGPLGNSMNGAAIAAMTTPQLIAALDQQSVLSHNFTLTNAANATSRGLEYVAYEGGQALYGQSGWQNDATFAATIIAANRDPAMRPLYLTHLNRWQAAGGGLFMHFNFMGAWSGAGCWGVFESMQQDSLTAYKYLGLMDYLEQFVLDAAPSGSPRTSLAVRPNPWRAGGRLELGVTTGEPVRVDVLDISGRLVRQVFNGTPDGPWLDVRWDGRDRAGRPLGSGIYFVRAVSQATSSRARIVLLGAGR